MITVALVYQAGSKPLMRRQTSDGLIFAKADAQCGLILKFLKLFVLIN